MRREILKQYLLALIVEGSFAGLKTPSAIAAKAASTFATDLPAVLSEMASVFADNAGHKMTSVLFEKVGDIVSDISKRGIKAVWAGVQEQYRRGVEVKHGKR